MNRQFCKLSADPELLLEVIWQIILNDEYIYGKLQSAGRQYLKSKVTFVI